LADQARRARSALGLPDRARLVRGWALLIGATLVVAPAAYRIAAVLQRPTGGTARQAGGLTPPTDAGTAGTVDAAANAVGSRCPPDMVAVLAGTFRMGSPAGTGDDDEHPGHDVTLSAYCIDRTEVTVKAYAACVQAKGCTAAPLTVQWSGGSAQDVQRYSRFCNREDRPDHPINCVDWNQAAAYCTWADKRLPSEAEWEYAARGTDGRVYPWGNETPSATRLNACGPECVAMAKRELNADWRPMYDTNDAWESTAPVGRFPAGASPFGALDMAGNVWEWTADWYGTYKATAATNPRGAEMGTERVIRGGGWYNLVAAVVGAAYRYRYEPSHRRHGVGFRCARGD
ncbi:MAG TPA: formylglycine-generating enzyme family protein, partial [Kofleriaceae bacterium]